MSERGYVQLRRGILDHLRDGRVSPSQFAIYCVLILEADSSSGVVRSSAKSLASRYGFRERTARAGLEDLEKNNYLRRWPCRGRHGEYPILVNRYRVTTGAMSGMRVDAFKSVSWQRPAFFKCDENVDEHVNENVDEHVDDNRDERAPYQEREGKKEKVRRVSAAADIPPLLILDEPGKETTEFQWPSVRSLMQLYNDLTPKECPAVDLKTRVSDGRTKKVKAALRAQPEKAYWERVFRNFHKSDWLKGLRPSAGYEDWRGNFDWVLSKGKDQIENYVKVYEGAK